MIRSMLTSIVSWYTTIFVVYDSVILICIIHALQLVYNPSLKLTDSYYQHSHNHTKLNIQHKEKLNTLISFIKTDLSHIGWTYLSLSIYLFI